LLQAGDAGARLIQSRSFAPMLFLLGILAVGRMPDGLFTATRHWLIDTYQRLAPAQRAESRTVVVEIDSESVRAVGPWPWPRARLAALVHAVRDAKVVGIDLLLVEPGHAAPAPPGGPADAGGGATVTPDGDTALAAAFRLVPVVLGAVAGNGTVDVPDRTAVATPVFEDGAAAARLVPRYSAAAWPFPALADAAHDVGLVNVPIEADGVVRRVPGVLGVGPSLVPGFAVQVLRVAMGAQRVVLSSGPGAGDAILVDGLSIPTDSGAGIRPRYTRAPPAATVPAHHVLAGRIDPAVFRDRIVLIGVNTPGLGDTMMTPLCVPQIGVSIQAHLLESMLAADTLWRPRASLALELILAAMGGVAAVFWVSRRRRRGGTLICGALILGLAAASFLAFSTAGLLADWILPASGIAVPYGIALAGRAREEVQARRQHAVELAAARTEASAARREAALLRDAEQARERLAIALDAAQMGGWNANLVTGAWEWSPRVDEILGGRPPPQAWTREAILGRVIDPDREAVATAFAAALRQGRLQVQARIRRPDGGLRWILLAGRVYDDGTGKPVRMAGVVSDITERRLADEAMHEARRLQTVGRIASGVAHNFNNLLAVVVGSIGLAQRQADDPAQMNKRLTAALEAANRGARLTRQLLAFARKEVLRSERLDLSAWLPDTIAMITASLEDIVSTETDIPGGLWPVRVDPGELELSLLNLCVNARDAMRQGGHFRITARNHAADGNRPDLHGRYVAITAADTGTGISPEILPHVFEPFVTTKMPGGGTGLGLSQVHGFAHQSGGAVDIESTVGKGTSVTLFLPAHDVTNP